MVLQLCNSSVFLPQKGTIKFFYLADAYTTNDTKLRICLVPKPETPKNNLSGLINSIVILKNFTKQILAHFNIVILKDIADSQIKSQINKILEPDLSTRSHYTTLAYSLLSNTVTKKTYSQALPLLFSNKSNSENICCYVSLTNGKIGFRYNNYIFPLTSFSKKESIINISSEKGIALTLTVKSDIDISQIKLYGNSDKHLYKEIQNRLQMFEKYLGTKNDYSSFFKFLYDNRENVRIAPYFKMLFNAKKDEYEKVFSFVVDKTLKVFLQPELLSIPVPKLDEKNTVLSEIKPLDIKEQFTYLDYRETKGIYYTFSDENEVLSEKSNITFNIMHLKRFAYKAGDILSDYFSFLSVCIQPTNKQIEFRYYKNEWNIIVLPIIIDQYTATITTLPSGIAKILWNIVTLVAQKINISERHSSVSHNNTNSAYIKREQSYKNQNATIELHRSRSMNSNANVLVINQQELNKGLAEKKMHYRVGHWHYYWYGAHNSAERHKELKWVEETIVNREAANIVIVL